MLCGICRRPLQPATHCIDGVAFAVTRPCADHPRAGYWWQGERYLSPSEMPPSARR